MPSHPHQYEFARLNLTYTVLSKRVLTELVRGGHVDGWDDPRMPTLAGLRRRGVPPEAIRDFVKRIGVAKANSVVDVGMFEFSIREHLNKTAQRRMAVLRPLKVVIENYPEGQNEELEAINHPEDPAARHAARIRFGRELYIERDDFMENPPKKFFRLSPGNGSAAALRLFHHLPRSREERRRRGGRTALHLRSRDQGRQRARRPQGAGDAALGLGGGCRCPRSAALQSAVHAARSERRPTSPTISIPIRWKCLTMRGVEPALADEQFRRAGAVRAPGLFLPGQGFDPEQLVFNRTVGLRDTWAKVSGGG